MTGRLILALAVLAARSDAANAQSIKPLELDSLITPASPALILVGASPVAIERPSTPKALALALASAIRDAEGLPKDIAVEFAPYWLTSHPTLTFADYYKAGLGQRLLQRNDGARIRRGDPVSLGQVRGRGHRGGESDEGPR